MVIMLLAEKSSDVRQNWSTFVDEVIHHKPKFVQRNDRDVFASMNMEYLSVLVGNIRYTINIDFDEETNEYVGTMDEFWFVESAKNEDGVKIALAEQLLEFAQDYYNDLKLYSTTPDFSIQFPKIMKALIVDDAQEITNLFDVKYNRA